MLGGVAFCVAFGESVEWSLACPGSGMAVSCCALVMSDLAADVVLAVSFAVPTCSTPSTFARGSLRAALLAGAFAFGGAGFSLQPSSVSAAVTLAAKSTR